jgi:hypothetical protein
MGAAFYFGEEFTERRKLHDNALLRPPTQHPELRQFASSQLTQLTLERLRNSAQDVRVAYESHQNAPELHGFVPSFARLRGCLSLRAALILSPDTFTLLRYHFTVAMLQQRSHKVRL